MNCLSSSFTLRILIHCSDVYVRSQAGIMAKKKKGLAPVNRGFATTSQPKKPAPVVEEPPEAEESVVPEISQKDGGPVGSTNNRGAKNGGVANSAAGQDDWENEFDLEEGIYQGYVERLQEKGEKEINRIIKVRPDFLGASRMLLLTKRIAGHRL